MISILIISFYLIAKSWMANHENSVEQLRYSLWQPVFFLFFLKNLDLDY